MKSYLVIADEGYGYMYPCDNEFPFLKEAKKDLKESKKRWPNFKFKIVSKTFKDIKRTEK